jgi:hypothetical protein
MTKVTSYVISKKLAEAGFKAESDCFWVKFEDDNKTEELFGNHATISRTLKRFPAYDFETLLDALPNSIVSYLKLSTSPGFVCSRVNEILYSVDRENGESLADVAAKVWLLLKEKGLLDESLSGRGN